MQLSGQDAADLKKNGYQWITIGEELDKKGVLVPKVVEPLPNYASLIIEDYGNLMMETEVLELQKQDNYESIKNLYAESIKIVGRFLNLTACPDS